MLERESEPSSTSSESESDSDPDDSTPSTSHCIPCNYESTEAMDSVTSCLGDFGKVALLKAKRNLTDHEKFTLLSTHFVPPPNYQFPTRNVGGRGRCFQHSWLEKHNGLVYSESQDGGIVNSVCFLLEMGLK